MVVLYLVQSHRKFLETIVSSIKKMHQFRLHWFMDVGVLSCRRQFLKLQTPINSFTIENKKKLKYSELELNYGQMKIGPKRGQHLFKNQNARRNNLGSNYYHSLILAFRLLAIQFMLCNPLRRSSLITSLVLGLATSTFQHQQLLVTPICSRWCGPANSQQHQDYIGLQRAATLVLLLDH